MFSTALRQRPDLPGIIALLTSSPAFKLRETSLTTHDLALPISAPNTQNPSTLDSNPQHQQSPTPTHQPFLILTPSSLSSPHLHERITRFSTLTTKPAPTIAFILSPSEKERAANGPKALMELQILLHTHPTPPPLLPIPTPSHLLPLLKIYTTTTTTTTLPTTPSPPPLHLLPHLTSTFPTLPLSPHNTNVLSDLTHSLRDVIALCTTSHGSTTLNEYFDGRTTRELAEFWEGEWIVD